MNKLNQQLKWTNLQIRTSQKKNEDKLATTKKKKKKDK